MKAAPGKRALLFAATLPLLGCEEAERRAAHPARRRQDRMSARRAAESSLPFGTAQKFVFPKLLRRKSASAFTASED
jgi:hypothetical protein